MLAVHSPTQVNKAPNETAVESEQVKRASSEIIHFFPTRGMSGGIPGGTAGQSGQERQQLAGTGAGSTGNESGDTAGRQIEAARGQGLSGQGGVF